MAYEMGWDLCPATSPISPPTSLPCHGRHVAFFPFLKYAKLVPVSGPLHTRLPLIGTPRSSCGGLLPIPWASAQMSPPRGGGALRHHSIQKSPPPSIALHCINPVRFLSQQVSGFCTYRQAPGETVLVWLIHGRRAGPGPQQGLSG